MQRISVSKNVLEGRLAPATVWGRRILLSFVITCGVGAIVLSLMSGQFDVSVFLPFVFVLIICQWRKTFEGIVDEVKDTGDSLWIKDKGEVENVPLSRVTCVEFTWRQLSGTSQKVLPVIRLFFRDTCKFGSEVAFVARTEGSGFSANSQEASAKRLVQDLQSRVKQAVR